MGDELSDERLCILGFGLPIVDCLKPDFETMMLDFLTALIRLTLRLLFALEGIEAIPCSSLVERSSNSCARCSACVHAMSRSASRAATRSRSN